MPVPDLSVDTEHLRAGASRLQSVADVFSSEAGTVERAIEQAIDVIATGGGHRDVVSSLSELFDGARRGHDRVRDHALDLVELLRRCAEEYDATDVFLGERASESR